MEDLQKFLRNNKNRLSEEEFESMYSDSYDMPIDEFTSKYDSILKEKGVGWSKLRKPKAKSVQERIRNEFGDDEFVVPENYRRDVWEEKFKDIPFEELSENIDKMRQYYEDEKKAAEYEAGRKRREKEVKEWPWYKDVLASEYEKERYINEPEAALFGKEATPITKELLSKGEAISDVLYGGAGAVGDFIPGIGTMLGPAARTARDVQHKASDSKYQKEWGDIGSDLVSDAAINLGTEYLPTAVITRAKRAGKSVSKLSDLGTDIRLELDYQQRKAANEIIEKNFDNISDAAENAKTFDLLLEKLPESDIKRDLVIIRNHPGFNKSKVNDYIDQYKDAKKATQNNNEMFGYKEEKGNIVPTERSEGYLGENAYDYFRTQERNKEITKRGLKSGLAYAAGKTGIIGGGIVKEIPTAKGRGEDVEINPENTKEWYKQNYTRDWLLGFTPEYKEGDPEWEAFEEEFPERAAEVKRKKEK